MLKVEHCTIFCESCEQSFSQNTLHEAILICVIRHHTCTDCSDTSLNCNKIYAVVNKHYVSID